MIWSLLLFLQQLTQSNQVPLGRYQKTETIFGQQIKASVTFKAHNTYDLTIQFETSALGAVKLANCQNQFYSSEDPKKILLQSSGYCKNISKSILNFELEEIAFNPDLNIVNLSFSHLKFTISLDLTEDPTYKVEESKQVTYGEEQTFQDEQCTAEGQDPNANSLNVACCPDLEYYEDPTQCYSVCVPTCTAEGKNIRQYRKVIPCCYGLKEYDENEVITCQQPSSECTGVNQDPWQHGRLIPCCDNLDYILEGSKYKCVAHDPNNIYVNHFDPNNPLKIQPAATRSNNYFLIIGDWGKEGKSGSWDCQHKVRDNMINYIKGQGPEKKLLFVLTVGDNFYWSGAQSWKFKSAWEDVYGVKDPASSLYNVPWLASMGNHDFGNDDPYAFCPDQSPSYLRKEVNGQQYASNQLNHDKSVNRPSGTELYWLPDFNYYYEIQEINLEVVVVDQNYTDFDGLGGDKSGHQYAIDKCGWTNAHNFLRKVKISGEQLLIERAQQSSGKTVVILQHYPAQANYIRWLFDEHSSNHNNRLFAYGHDHKQRCDHFIDNYTNCDMILTGGGGGCCTSYVTNAGFTAVHLTEDRFIADVTSQWVCNYGNNCYW